MEKVSVVVYAAGHNYCAHTPILPGCIRTASSLEDMKIYIKEAIELEVKNSLKNNEPIPEVLKGEYELDFVIISAPLKNVYL